MLRHHILIKFSDVFDAAPDPAAYFQEVQRSVGDIPLNIFSTVNGYFATPNAGIGAQSALARELLNPLVRDMVGRFRSTVAGTDSVIFTRPSGLLNLKALLAVPREDCEYIPTSVGMLALHANDYTDISLPEADPELFAVQNLPIGELHNPRDVADLLARYYFVTQEMYGRDEAIIELFANELGQPPGSVPIDGLTFEDYFALLFGLYTAAAHAGQVQKTAILNLEEHLRLLGLSDEQAAQFVAERVGTEDFFVTKFGRVENAEAFATRIFNPTWALDFSVFRERPLLRLRDGRVVVIDLQFLIENASVGIFWNVFGQLSNRGKKLLLGYWGTVFERYIHQQMQAHPVARGYYTFNAAANGLETDALLVEGRDIFVFEIKAGMLRHDVKCSRDVSVVRESIERKFVQSSKGSPKGISQLAKRCAAISNHGVGGQTFDRVYPILVVDELGLQTPGMNTYLARRLRSAAPDRPTVRLLTVITADELEVMLPYLSAGDVTWQELIESRDERGEVSAKPAHITFWEIVASRNIERRNNAILGPVRNHLAELLRRKYDHLKP